MEEVKKKTKKARLEFEMLNGRVMSCNKAE
jgi:hypothetical protein